MNKKSVLAILLVLTLCFTLITPGAVVSFADTAEPAESAATTEEISAAEEVDADEKAVPAMAAADGVVAGSGEYIMEYDDYLDPSDSWTYELTTVRPCTLYFYTDSNEEEYTYAYFNITITNKETGEILYDVEDWVDSDYYYEDSKSLDPGTYIISYTNTDYDTYHYYFDAYYEPLHTADDPYYCIDQEYLFLYTGTTATLKAQVLPSPATYETVTWSSENPDVAAVDENGVVTAVSEGETIITADIDGHTAKCYVYTEDPEYTINATSATLYVKDTKTLKVTVDPADYGLEGLTWTSSNPAVASVNSSGLVTAKAAGTATITAAVNGAVCTCKVTVKPMAMSAAKATVYVKKTKTLKVNGGSGTTTWKSGNKKIATVNKNGVVKGIKPGTTTITATKNGKKFKCKVTVKWEPETGVKTTKTYGAAYAESVSKKIVIKGNATVKITATNKGVYDAEADEWDWDYDPTLHVALDKITSDGSYVGKYNKYIDPGKTVTKTLSLTKGTYELYMDTDQPYKVTVNITTKPTISKTSTKLGKGFKETLSVVGVKNGGKWSSTNKKIATVNSKGVVTAKKKGTCYIKYTMKTGKVVKCKVKVVTPVTVKVTGVNDVAILNDCYVTFRNYTNKKITYLEFNIKQYNGRGSRVSSPYDYYYLDPDIKAKGSLERVYWVNNNALSCKAYITKVWFSDGTTWRP